MCSGHFPATFRSCLRGRQASLNREVPAKEVFQRILQGPLHPHPPPSKALTPVWTPVQGHEQRAETGFCGSTDWCVLHSDFLRNRPYHLKMEVNLKCSKCLLIFQRIYPKALPNMTDFWPWRTYILRSKVALPWAVLQPSSISYCLRVTGQIHEEHSQKVYEPVHLQARQRTIPDDEIMATEI